MILALGVTGDATNAASTSVRFHLFFRPKRARGICRESAEFRFSPNSTNIWSSSIHSEGDGVTGAWSPSVSKTSAMSLRACASLIFVCFELSVIEGITFVGATSDFAVWVVSTYLGGRFSETMKPLRLQRLE